MKKIAAANIILMALAMLSPDSFSIFIFICLICIQTIAFLVLSIQGYKRSEYKKFSFFNGLVGLGYALFLFAFLNRLAHISFEEFMDGTLIYFGYAFIACCWFLIKTKPVLDPTASQITASPTDELNKAWNKRVNAAYLMSFLSLLYAGIIYLIKYPRLYDLDFLMIYTSPVFCLFFLLSGYMLKTKNKGGLYLAIIMCLLYGATNIIANHFPFSLFLLVFFYKGFNIHPQLTKNNH